MLQSDVGSAHAHAHQAEHHEIEAIRGALIEAEGRGLSTRGPNDIRKAVIDLSFSPVLCGSAFKNKGVQAVLDAVCAYLPSPLDLPAVSGINPDTDKEESRAPEVSAPFAALAFKIATDPFVGRLAFMRVYSGKLDAGSYVYNMRTNKRERISRLMQMHSNKQNPLLCGQASGAGDLDLEEGFAPGFTPPPQKSLTRHHKRCHTPSFSCLVPLSNSQTWIPKYH